MKIVIVGGGTAGWMAACYAARFNHSGDNINDITVIESSKIPIIGAGEGSTGTFTQIVNHHFRKWGINEPEFLNKTKSTLKLGIRFKDWNGVGTEFLSPVQPSETNLHSIDTHLLASHILGDYANASPSGYLMNKDLSSYVSKDGKTIFGHSYHFDAHAVGKYWKEYALKNDVKVVDTEVISLNKNPQSGELDSIKTTNGIIEGDLWIDCSGFARVLINPMGGGWKSYSEYLPTNNAMPFIEQFEPNETPKLETLSQALPNGWMWKIPTQDRYGCGYVYSDMFTTQEKALAELRKSLGRDVEPIRNIKFEAGRLENIWVKNVVAVGLAAGFVEPLEATSIHATIVQLDYLSTIALNFATTKENINFETNVNQHNTFLGKLFDDIKDLIQLHYMSDREDTDFWKYCKYDLKRTDKVKHILEVAKHRSPSMLDFDFYHGAGNWGVWCWTMMGMGHITKEVSKHTLYGYRHTKESIKDEFEAVNRRNMLNGIKVMKNSEFFNALKKGEIRKK
jgi:tryptophan halogenase